MKKRPWSSEHQDLLRTVLHSSNDGFLNRKLAVLLHVGEGAPVHEASRLSGIGKSSIYRWMDQFLENKTPEALKRLPGQGRPSLWNRKLEALLRKILKHSPVDLGYPANGWNVHLLKTYLAVHAPEQEVSATSLRRYLTKAGYSWKRFRHSLERDPLLQKKRDLF